MASSCVQKHRYRHHALTASLSVLSVVMLLFVCYTESEAFRTSRRDVKILSLTEISGVVNNSRVEGEISATLHTGGGGVSTCQFSHLPKGFTPGTFGTHQWTSHHTAAGLSRVGEEVFNLYDLTRGNYQVRRTVSYPEFPKSQIVFHTEVKAVNDSEWFTTITVQGTYDGPTDVVGVADYEVVWTSDGETLFERGSATLKLSDGGAVLSEWSSEIVPTGQTLRQFPREGEFVKVSYSPFNIDGGTMSYNWGGTVQLHK